MDGSDRVISMPRSADEAISRAPYSAEVKINDRATFQASRPTLVPLDCLNIQEDVSSYATRPYPRSTEKMKITPRLISPSLHSNFSER